ncbi:hypothetical protein ARMGADRAFT_1121218 [Armillaria gallica]|uniref:Uncharacterized protein n=1 Tax=Armillaria gallica TaxID=47427 RepID=A0A2H3D9J6_ARMGA|nr:hypothetical protein ARMGADRAFT_1121218 [Armillaria gallica]
MLKTVFGCNTQEEMKEWHEFCASSPYEQVQNWYKQKIMYPWYLSSDNQFLSPMDDESWSMIPNDTNIVESCHSGRNAETGIGRAILDAINNARQEQMRITEEISIYEEVPDILPVAWNGPRQRDHKNANRRKNNHSKLTQRDGDRRQLDEYQHTLQDLKDSVAKSMARTKDLEQRIKDIQASLPTFSRKDARWIRLNTEKADAVSELKRGVDERRQLKRKIKQINESEEYRSLQNQLKGLRRPTTMTTEPRDSANKENINLEAPTGSQAAVIEPIGTLVPWPIDTTGTTIDLHESLLSGYEFFKDWESFDYSVFTDNTLPV